MGQESQISHGKECWIMYSGVCFQDHGTHTPVLKCELCNATSFLRALCGEGVKSNFPGEKPNEHSITK